MTAQTDVTSSLDQLFPLEDKAFVEGAFQLFLNRAPSDEEVKFFLKRIRRGDRKILIAHSIRYSQEGKSIPQKVSLGIKDRLIAQLSSLPLVGNFFNLLIAIIGSAQLKRSFDANINLYYRLTENQSNQLHEISTIQQNTIIEFQKKLEASKHEIHILNAKLSEAESWLTNSRARLTLLEQSYSPIKDDKQNNDLAASTTEPNRPDQINEAFYIAFEEKYRGSQEEILGRLSFYLPLLKDTLSTGPLSNSKIIDLGCGRGEWLDLLKTHGYRAEGVDSNAQNVSNCNDRSLVVHHNDAISWLSSQPDSSLSCVSAFHLIEHLTFNTLTQLVDQALRCLQPGGLIILETPNPENLLVGTNNFYLDPTHIRPIPSTLMKFMLTYKGFTHVNLHHLHPAETEVMIPEKSEVAKRCNELFYGAFDYAVVARKPGIPQTQTL